MKLVSSYLIALVSLCIFVGGAVALPVASDVDVEVPHPHRAVVLERRFPPVEDLARGAEYFPLGMSSRAKLIALYNWDKTGVEVPLEARWHAYQAGLASSDNALLKQVLEARIQEIEGFFPSTSNQDRLAGRRGYKPPRIVAGLERDQGSAASRPSDDQLRRWLHTVNAAGSSSGRTAK
ncbi:uncharacterized protein PFL1_04792 [Pseudozyma flocculosa PF-1]|uniref:Uncharacterized protein n=1 Tax=Pseudozyma flocculosa PF-1 TaxID=1277687 RepID=A0A061H5D2_9BASI|nr:uncharacterized protein PFL1_04792 [Pseudozyma flocculosa PF-1]EPQ27654.1 hypothetical protein PFL1_04792 [Pseudozyma flocculosa PF-1]